MLVLGLFLIVCGIALFFANIFGFKIVVQKTIIISCVVAAIVFIGKIYKNYFY